MSAKASICSKPSGLGHLRRPLAFVASQMGLRTAHFPINSLQIRQKWLLSDNISIQQRRRRASFAGGGS